MSKDYKTFSLSRELYAVNSMTKITESLVKQISEHAEQTILDQLNEFISRGLIVAEIEQPVIVQSYLAPDQDAIKINVARKVVLKLKDQEYIERLEDKIQGLEQQLNQIKENYDKIKDLIK